MKYYPKGEVNPERACEAGMATIRRWLLQVAGALRHMHEHAKVAHRDVKCSNLLIGDGGLCLHTHRCHAIHARRRGDASAVPVNPSTLLSHATTGAVLQATYISATSGSLCRSPPRPRCSARAARRRGTPSTERRRKCCCGTCCAAFASLPSAFDRPLSLPSLPSRPSHPCRAQRASCPRRCQCPDACPSA